MIRHLIFLALACSLHAGDRTFEWDANPPDNFVVRYDLHEKLSPGWAKVGESTTTAITIPVSPGPHTYMVTAISAFGMESEQSNEVTFTEPLPPPRNLRLKVQISTDLQHWTTFAEVDAPAPEPRAFYQLAYE